MWWPCGSLGKWAWCMLMRNEVVGSFVVLKIRDGDVRSGIRPKSRCWQMLAKLSIAAQCGMCQ